jgi:enoyl-CoA hydratase
MAKPVIAEVRGLCLAGGTDLALVCDIIIASKSASFGYPPVRDMGSPPAHMWLYHLGPQWAKRLLLTGDTLNATDAATLGLILKAVPDECLEDEVRRLCNRMGMIDTALLGANKRIVNLGMELMGARTLQRLAAENDGRAHQAGSPRRFRELAQSGGLKAAILERNHAFGSPSVRIDGPDEDKPRDTPVP